MNCKVVKIKEQISYKDAAMLQHQMFALINAEVYDGVLLILEHKPVITMGVDTDLNNLLVSEEELTSRGIDLSKTDRDGGITFHGPGQIIAYPILKISNFNLKSSEYMHKLELVINDTINQYELKSYQKDECPGVWVNNTKICFIGVKERKSITYHGLAFDVTSDKSNYNLIKACGMNEYKVSTLNDFVTDVEIEKVKNQVIDSFNKIFEVSFETIELEEILPQVS